ncbi:hypothetical protein KY348_04775 [Candidatus Woesearchaeota archaeon]|nr:hypothetical protein [Candidatus Woesearchaeota archaeon]
MTHSEMMPVAARREHVSVSKKYSIEESGLTKLIFENLPLNFTFREQSFKINELKIEQGMYNETSKNKKVKISLPCYLVHGVLKDEKGLGKGYFKGPIYPKVFKLREEIWVLGHTPYFDFYFEISGKPYLCSKIDFSSKALKARVKEGKSMDPKEIKPDLRAGLKPFKIPSLHKKELVYFTRDG